MSSNIDELRWVRAFTPDIIPKYLVEQVRDRDYSVEDFYKYQQLNCMTKEGDSPKLNPLNNLWVLVNPENEVKGFLWFVIDTLGKDIVINTFSMDKEYWGGGKAVKKAAEYVKEFLKKLQFNKVYWITNYPKHSERHGFKRSKSILMEYSEEPEEKDG